MQPFRRDMREAQIHQLAVIYLNLNCFEIWRRNLSY